MFLISLYEPVSLPMIQLL